MIVYTIIAYLLAAAYTLLFLLYDWGWFRQKYFQTPKNFVPSTKISVVIAARNEQENIEACVQSIVRQDYPENLFDIIVVDDCSNDKTLQLLYSMGERQLKVISLSDYLDPHQPIVSYKKKALELGILQSQAELIVTTDADCVVPKRWLKNIACMYQQHGAKMIVAPVRFKVQKKLLHIFQALDFTTMQGITAATVRLNLGVMCNGANLAFDRTVFWGVGGYQGIDHLVSGDDYLLQSKFRQMDPKSVLYLKTKDAIVDTLVQDSWRGFIQQRIRWASKTGKYKDPIMSVMLLVVYLFNLFFSLLLLAGFFIAGLWKILSVLLIAKIGVEILFLFGITSFFGNRSSLLFFPFLQPLHILYIIVAGFMSRVSTFEWKQRNFKQS